MIYFQLRLFRMSALFLELDRPVLFLSSPLALHQRSWKSSSCGEAWNDIEHGLDAWCQSRSDPKLKCNAWLLGPCELNSPFLKVPLNFFKYNFNENLVEAVALKVHELELLKEKKKYGIVCKFKTCWGPSKIFVV